MKIIISPAKKMTESPDFIPPKTTPPFPEKTTRLMNHIQSLTYPQAKALWSCNDKIARQNYDRFARMDLTRAQTPALLAYEGIQYQYMAPAVFQDSQWSYVQEHLRILSAFYGVVRPLDAIVPYRLEMQAKINLLPYKTMYSFWSDTIYREITRDASWILNLASKEYSKCIEDYLEPGIPYITCVFGERKGTKIVQKATLAKMARGEMVRYLSLHNITSPDGLKDFHGLGFQYREEYSTSTTYTYIKEAEK